MSETVACPNCGKQFKAKPEILGKRVRCPGCKESFTAESNDPFALVESDGQPPVTAAPSQSPARAATVWSPPVTRPKPIREPAGEWSQSRKAVFKLGSTMLVMGVLALILPFLGLQFKAINQSGTDPVTIAIVLMISGGVICGMATLLGRWGKLIFRVSLGLVLLIVLVFAIGIWNATHRTPLKPIHTAAPNYSPSTPFKNPMNPIDPVTGLPRARMAGPVGLSPDYSTMVQQFGADKVVKIHVNASSKEALKSADLFKTLSKSLRQSESVKTSRYTPAGDHADYWAAPAEDLDEIASNLPFDAKKISIDRATRTIVVDLTNDPPGSGVKP